MSHLPANVKRDLDRAAAGIGRTPTAAHPDCICGKVVSHRDCEHATPIIYGRPDDCPQHKPEPKR